MATFEGNVYIRPLGRGVCISNDMIDFEDWLTEALGMQSVGAGGEDVSVRITVECLDTAATRGTTEAR